MKICIVTSIFPPDIGGPAIYTYEVAKRLGKKHTIEVIAFSNLENARDFDVHIAGKKHLIKSFGIFWGVIRFARGSDLIYIHDASIPGFFALIASKIIRKPTVLKFVGDAAWEAASNTQQTKKYLEDFLRSPEGGIYVRMLLRLQKFVLNRVDKVIVPSYFLKSILTKYYYANPNKIKVIYNSIDLVDYNQTLSNHFNEFGNPKIITVGRLVRLKRIDKIIKAIREIKENYPDIKLLVVGDGPEKAHLEKISKELRTEENVKFLGNRHHDDVIELIRESDIFVLNSVYEGLPHVVIEAMACRTPVIATNIKGTDEVVKDSETGLQIGVNNKDELKEKIILLLKDKELRSKLIENAYKNIEKKFTWSRNLTMLEKKLEEML